jgi:hypothetical protein
MDGNPGWHLSEQQAKQPLKDLPMTNVNIVLSQRSVGVIVLPLTRDIPDANLDATVTSTPTIPKLPDGVTPAIAANANGQIWEILADVDIRVLFNGNVSATTGRKLKAGIPYTFAATAGSTPSMMLA